MKKKPRINIEEVRPLLSAINLATAVNVPVLKSQKRNRKLYFLRMIFADHCKDKYTLNAISQFLRRKSHGSVVRMINRFHDELNYTDDFKKTRSVC